MRSLFASLGRRKRPDRVLRAAGRSIGAIARAIGRAKTTITRELQRNALPAGGIRRFTPPEPINCAGGVKRSSNERAALRLRSSDRLAEGWTPEQISGWLKCGNEPPTAGHRLRDNLRLHLSNRTEGRGFVALSDASPQTPSPASIETFARHHQGSSVNP